MIEIDGRIITTDILTECFSCDVSRCKGMCCVEGNAGAPLEKEELEVLEAEYDNFREYMTPEGRAAVVMQGLYTIDFEGDYTTPLVDDADCAYAFQQDGITLCAIEKAYREGKTTYKKPISCHLYPIRVTRFNDGTEGLNYHRWDVCESARVCGKQKEVPVYKSLVEPIVRRFGPDFYDALEAAAQYVGEE